MNTLSLYTLGRFRATRDNETIPDDAWGTQKTKSLLKILLTHRGHALTKDQLIEWLWQDLAPDSAGRELRVAVSQLRRALEPDLPRGSQSNFILTTDAGYAFNADAECWSDAEEFQTRYAEFESETKTEQIERARLLYQGDYLEEDRYADWSVTRREQLREMHISLLTGMAELYARQRRYPLAIELCQQVLAADRVRESIWRALMLYHYHAGDLGQALRTFEECQKVLAEELGVEPLPETRALFERVRQREIVRDYQTIPSNLATHTPPTAFIGRDDERQELARLLKDSATRLVTLIGAGGIGKSRLALQVGADRLDQFRDGVYFVPLASVSESEFIVTAIASALNISFYGQEEPRAQLLIYLRSKHMLLILDNFEHLLDGAALLTDILQNAPEMKILVTARKSLILQAEWILDVQGLSYPRVESAEAAESFSAVQLFLQSARRVQTRFEPSQQDLEQIVRICQALEGMPLGIELAAAWVRALSCSQIAQQVAQNLDLLSVTWSDVPERHHSLRAVFDHSLKLLTPQEANVFERLSVFRGGFTFEAAERVAGASLQSLASFVDASLLHRESAGRYDVHELLRQYLEARLAEIPNEKQKIRDLHAAFFAKFLRERERSLQSPRQREVLDEIAIEIGNVRAAWHWAIQRKQTEWIAQCLEGLYLFYEIRSWFQEGVTLFEKSVEQLRAASDASNSVLIARIVARTARLYFRISLYDKAREMTEKCLMVFRARNIQKEIGICLHVLGTVDLLQGQFRQAQEELSEGLQVNQASGDIAGMANILNSLGIVARFFSNAAEAKQYHQKSLALAEEMGDPYFIASSLNYLGAALWMQGEYADAQQKIQQSLDLFRKIENRWGIAMALTELGRVISTQGDYALAKKLQHEALALAQEVGSRLYTSFANERLGEIELTLGNFVEARDFIGISLAMSQQVKHAQGIVRTLNLMGILHSTLGDHAAAKKSFFDALTLAVDRKLIPLGLQVLVGIATLLAKENEAARALELTLVVVCQPASWHTARTRAERLVSELKAALPATSDQRSRRDKNNMGLPANIVAAAHARAKTLNFEEVAQAFLEERKEWGG